MYFVFCMKIQKVTFSQGPSQDPSSLSLDSQLSEKLLSKQAKIVLTFLGGNDQNII